MSTFSGGSIELSFALEKHVTDFFQDINKIRPKFKVIYAYGQCDCMKALTAKRLGAISVIEANLETAASGPTLIFVSRLRGVNKVSAIFYHKRPSYYDLAKSPKIGI